MMKRLKTAVSYHKSVFFLAALVGVVYLSHHFFISSELKERGEIYTPISFTNYDEAAFYSLRAKAAYSGDLLVGDINLQGRENGPAFLPILNPLIMAGLAQITGSLDRAFVASDFVFPFLIFLALYFIMFELTGVRLYSLVFASLFIFIPKFVLFPSAEAWSFFDNKRELYFSRFEYPNVTFIFFAAAIYFFLRLMNRGDRLSLWGTGISFGATFYTYLYDWLYLALALIITSFILFVRRDLKRLSLLFRAALIAAVVSIYYWFNFFSLRGTPSWSDLVARIGVETGRSFRLDIVWPSYLRALSLSAALFWFLRGQKGVISFLAGALLAIIAALNIQLITGMVPQPDHWNRVQFIFLAIAAFVLIRRIWILIRRRFKLFLPEKTPLSLGLVIIVIILASALNSQFVWSKENVSSYALDRDYHEAFSFLSDWQQSVIGTLSEQTAAEIILYTPHKIFLPNGSNTTASTSEIWRRAEVLARWHGLSPQAFESFVVANNKFMFFDQYNDRSFGSYFRRAERVIPTDVLKSKVNEYRKLPRRPDTFRLDLVVIGERERAAGAKEIGAPAKKVFDKKGVVIYDVRTP